MAKNKTAKQFHIERGYVIFNRSGMIVCCEWRSELVFQSMVIYTLL